ncbi:hypothetical protein SAMN06297251_1122 [Fulvimarina manganoxydans]|uniref:Uncharacterized protein n=1 Tax=Fulvimarina manganoxydans TaxID=937218 RepID=A0A1W2CZ16_9HYPH|nr:hypothetical protein SAMN06297251_1122 [Fulvimarina manganoxydans]
MNAYTAEERNAENEALADSVTIRPKRFPLNNFSRPLSVAQSSGKLSH